MRRFIVSLAGLLVVIGCVIWYVVRQAKEAQPGREVVASSLMDYCRSEANTSPDKSAQLEFLRKNQLIVNGDRLDIMVGDWSIDVTFVRYYTGARSSGGVSWRCKFGLAIEVSPGKARGYFIRDGQHFEPGPDEFCLSDAPPVISHDRMSATLQCNQVVKQRLD